MNIITEEFLDETDALIKHIREYPVVCLNGEVMIAKQPPPKKTAGGLLLTGDYKRREGYFHGLGRVIMVPKTPYKAMGGELPLEEDIKVGDFVLYTHTARYKPAAQILNFLLDKKVEEDDVKDQYEAEFQDNGMLYLIPQADIKMVRNGYSVYRQVKQI